MADKIKISFKPTKKQFSEIQDWLLEESISTGEGFYCNLNQISSSFKEKQLAVISLNQQTIGFASWRVTSKLTARIEIVEINRFFRKKGFGRQLMSALFQRFIENNIVVTDLQCSPSNSEPIWRQFGFIDFPNHNDTWNVGNKKLFKILVPSLPTIERNSESETIELWDDEPYCTQKKQSTWKWELVFKRGTGELQKPIIIPCHHDWRIRWRNQDRIVKEDKVKYFSKEDIEFGTFLIISKLPKES